MDSLELLSIKSIVQAPCVIGLIATKVTTLIFTRAAEAVDSRMSTHKLILYVLVSVADANQSADAAHIEFKSWKQSPPSERRRLLLKTADILESMTPQFIEVMAQEVGVSGFWAGFNVHLAANVFREAAAMVTQIQGEATPKDKPGALSMTIRQPVGAVLSIVPWNNSVANDAIQTLFLLRA
jgi:acyl-CoA reductase-like NAD-dependent aldehyde dehydrogenase